MDQAAATCLNCRARLLGPYCHECGQSAHIHRTLTAWWHDFSHGVLHIEGAAGHTLVMLVRAPGALTRRYVAGERRRFLAPLPLYLFSVFVLYVVFALCGGVGHVGFDVASGHPARIDAALRAADAAIVQAQGPSGQASLVEANGASHTRTLAQLQARRKQLLQAQALTKDPQGAIAGVLEAHRLGWKPLDDGILRAVEDPDFLIFKLEADGYKFSWLLIPISVPLLTLLFIRRRGAYMFDHAVFVTYSLSFVSLLLTALTLAGRLNVPYRSLLLLAFPVHLFFQLRGAYRLSIPGTALRIGPVLVIAAVALLVWIVLLLALGLLA